MVDSNEDYYLLKVQRSLLDHTFHTSKYITTDRFDGTKVRRISKLPYYPDRIVQWALMIVISPILIKSFIDHTYSAIPKRGIHLCLKRMARDINSMKSDKIYCLKMDIHHYFQSIDRGILYKIYCNKFTEEDVRWLIKDIIYSFDEGIPIGNYTSQYSGNFYLSKFDHHCKEQLKCKYYYRYMDDICIFSTSKIFLHKLLNEIQTYLKTNLHLELKSNYQIFPIDNRGIDFIGYRIFSEYILLRKSISKKLISKSTNLQAKENLTYNDCCSIQSYYGWTKRCNGYNLWKQKTLPIKNNQEQI